MSQICLLFLTSFFVYQCHCAAVSSAGFDGPVENKSELQTYIIQPSAQPNEVNSSFIGMSVDDSQNTTTASVSFGFRITYVKISIFVKE